MSARTYLGFLPWIVFARHRPRLARRRRVGRRRRPRHGRRDHVRVGPRPIGEGARDLLDRAVRLARGGGRAQPARSAGFPAALPQRRWRSGRWPCFAVASLAFQPFTEQYAREIVQRKYWNTSRFNRANVELTLMWAAVFVRDRRVAARRPARSRPGSAARSSTGCCRSASWCSGCARRRCAGATSSTTSRWASTPCSTSASSGKPPDAIVIHRGVEQGRSAGRVGRNSSAP